MIASQDFSILVNLSRLYSFNRCLERIRKMEKVQRHQQNNDTSQIIVKTSQHSKRVTRTVGFVSIDSSTSAFRAYLWNSIDVAAGVGVTITLCTCFSSSSSFYYTTLRMCLCVCNVIITVIGKSDPFLFIISTDAAQHSAGLYVAEESVDRERPSTTWWNGSH